MAEILTPDDERRIIEAVLLLGMTPPFTVEAARDQYRRLARIYHPDAGRTADAERFKALGEAVRTVEAHAAAFASGGLAWNAGGASGGARASQAAQLLEKLSAAEMTIVQKDSELHRLRLERDFAARQTAEKKRRGPSAGVIFTGYVLLLGVVAIMGVLLAAKSQPREATLEAFTVTLDPVTVEGVDATGDKYSLALAGAQIEIGPVEIRSEGNTASRILKDTTGSLTANGLQVGIAVPARTLRIPDTILVDAFRIPMPDIRRVYAVLRDATALVAEYRINLKSVSTASSVQPLAENGPPEFATVLSGYAQTQNHDGPRPPWWPTATINPPPDDPINKADPTQEPKLPMIGIVRQGGPLTQPQPGAN